MRSRQTSLNGSRLWDSYVGDRRRDVTSRMDFSGKTVSRFPVALPRFMRGFFFCCRSNCRSKVSVLGVIESRRSV